MSFKIMSNSRFHSIAAASAERNATRAGKLERGRKTILYGWIISMIGIVTYCFVMTGGDQQADVVDALAARGSIGWAAIAVIGIGIALWFAGCIQLLKDADSPQGEDGEC